MDGDVLMWQTKPGEQAESTLQLSAFEPDRAGFPCGQKPRKPGHSFSHSARPRKLFSFPPVPR